MWQGWPCRSVFCARQQTLILLVRGGRSVVRIRVVHEAVSPRGGDARRTDRRRADREEEIGPRARRGLFRGVLVRRRGSDGRSGALSGTPGVHGMSRCAAGILESTATAFGTDIGRDIDWRSNVASSSPTSLTKHVFISPYLSCDFITVMRDVNDASYIMG